MARGAAITKAQSLGVRGSPEVAHVAIALTAGPYTGLECVPVNQVWMAPEDAAFVRALAKRSRLSVGAVLGELLAPVFRAIRTGRYPDGSPVDWGDAFDAVPEPVKELVADAASAPKGRGKRGTGKGGRKPFVEP